MTATHKTDDNVIQRRRADDWKRPLSVPVQDAFDWREGDTVAFLDDRATARVGAALSGARTLVAILMQQDLDRHSDDDEVHLRLGEITTQGLFEALASCLEVASLHATGGSKALWTTSLYSDDPEAQHLRRAARDASITEGNRRAAEHAEQLRRAQAAKKGAA